MVKINNIEYKIVNIFYYIVCLAISLFSIFPFLNNDIKVGIGFLVTGCVVFVLMISTSKWPETILVDEKQIVVKRLGKEINRITWEQVTEIYKKDIKNLNRLNCSYYFSDGQDRFLQTKNGNEHFVVFSCPKNKEHLFLKFTNLPIKSFDTED